MITSSIERWRIINTDLATLFARSCRFPFLTSFKFLSSFPSFPPLLYLFLSSSFLHLRLNARRRGSLLRQPSPVDGHVPLLRPGKSRKHWNARTRMSTFAHVLCCGAQRSRSHRWPSARKRERGREREKTRGRDCSYPARLGVPASYISWEVGESQSHGRGERERSSDWEEAQEREPDVPKYLNQLSDCPITCSR